MGKWEAKLHLKIIKIVPLSTKTPKTNEVYCLVPGCDRTWFLTGGNQGFQLAAAQAHAYAHWRRYHEEQKHPRAVWKDSTNVEHEGYEFCNICKAQSQEQWNMKGEKG
jgi:hypothetical protein